MLSRRQKPKKTATGYKFGNRGQKVPPGRLAPLHPVSKLSTNPTVMANTDTDRKLSSAARRPASDVDFRFQKSQQQMEDPKSKEVELLNMSFQPRGSSEVDVCNNALTAPDQVQRNNKLLVTANRSNRPSSATIGGIKSTTSSIASHGSFSSKKSLAISNALKLLTEQEEVVSPSSSSSSSDQEGGSFDRFLFYRHFAPFDEPCLITRPLYFTDSMMHTDAVSRRNETLKISSLIDIDKRKCLWRQCIAGTIVAYGDEIYSIASKFNLDDVPLSSLRISWRLHHHQPAPTLPLVFILLNRVGVLLSLVRVSSNRACAVFKYFHQAQRAMAHYNPIRGQRFLLVDWWYKECANADVSYTNGEEVEQWVYEQLDQVGELSKQRTKQPRLPDYTYEIPAESIILRPMDRQGVDQEENDSEFEKRKGRRVSFDPDGIVYHAKEKQAENDEYQLFKTSDRSDRSSQSRRRDSRQLFKKGSTASIASDVVIKIQRGLQRLSEVYNSSDDNNVGFPGSIS